MTRRTDPPHQQYGITLRWIAAHKEVKGNEKADEEAKEAAAGIVSSPEHLPPILRSPLSPSVGVTKYQYLWKRKDEWAVYWGQSPRRDRMEKIDENFSFKQHRKSLDQFTRLQSS